MSSGKCTISNMGSNRDFMKYDETFLGILQDANSIPAFIDNVYSFLLRRTDFFYTPTEEEPNLGYKEGVAETMAIEAFKRYKKMFDDNKVALEAQRKHEIALKKEKATGSKPAKSKELPIGAPVANVEKEGDHRSYLADAECYNGAVRDKYSWGQKHDEITVFVKIPPTVTTAKQLEVKVQRKHLKVVAKPPNCEPDVIIDEDLSWEIRTAETQWSFEKETHKLEISCDKADERWWDSLLVSEEKLDTSKIDCSRPMDTLDEEGQAKIAQLQYDSKQKQMGLPTSKEQSVHESLRKAWDSEGSPFKGTPFDPSKLNIQCQD